MKYARTYIQSHRNTESINLLFQFPKFRLVGVFHFLYPQGAKWKKWLIHWNENQEKTTSIGFQFHRPKEKAVLHIFLIIVKYVKRAYETGNRYNFPRRNRTQIERT